MEIIKGLPKLAQVLHPVFQVLIGIIGVVSCWQNHSKINKSRISLEQEELL
jgi:hypothetical protein